MLPPVPTAVLSAMVLKMMVAVLKRDRRRDR
jgi:hypothetical protein